MTDILKRSEKLDLIIDSAYKVFYENGFHAAGVDSLLIDTGISKRTLYKYFRSKEDLIAATVKHFQHLTFKALGAELERRTDDPKQKILEIFKMKKEAFEQGNFTGCFATNAKLEFEGKNPLIEQSCTCFVRSVEDFIAGLCDEAGVKDPKKSASKIMMLLQGTIVYGQSTRSPEAADNAYELVKEILDK